MKISLEWLSDYLQLPTGLVPKQIAHDLTMTTVEVEGIEVHSSGDIVLEIDNKSLTNRPDLWGHYGIARELAAIYDLDLRELSGSEEELPDSSELVSAVDPSVCNRFSLLHVVAAAGTPAPAWIRSRLERIGQRSVNLWTDLSNYVMYAIGQPTHAYDRRNLSIPLAIETVGERVSVNLLNGEARTLEPGLPVVTSARLCVAIAGVMGDMTTATGLATEEVLLEAANFDAASVRRASQQLDLRTESSARFEKSIDTQRIDSARSMFLQLLRSTTPTARVLASQDVVHASTERRVIELGPDFIERRIGRSIPERDVAQKLSKLGFGVEPDGGALLVTVPTWRSTGDVSLPHDLVEEIARLTGYENFAPTPPVVALASPIRRPRLVVERRLREQIAARGSLQEIVTYPWASDAMLAAFGVSKGRTITFEGAPSPDRSSLRPLLLPNVLEAVAGNLRHRPTFGLFEVGTVFKRVQTSSEGDAGPIVAEERHLAGAIVGVSAEEVFLRAKGILESLGRVCQIGSFEFSSSSNESWASAQLGIVADGEAIGAIGTLAGNVARVAEVSNAAVVMFELNIDGLTALPSRENRYLRLSEFPPVRFDLSIIVGTQVPWERIAAVAWEATPLAREVMFVDDYRGIGVGEERKSVTFRLTLQADDRTLTGGDISSIRDQLVESLKDTLGAELRS